MRRAGPLALTFVLLTAPALAETCSRSTLASSDYAYARWCGDPANTGTLRVARRDGRAAEYRDVLIRTHQVARFLAAEVEGKFRRVGGEARPVAQTGRAESPMPVPPMPPSLPACDSVRLAPPCLRR